MATKNIDNPVKQKMLEFTLPVGTVLKNGNNEYRIVEVLGAGGFGITYKVSSTIMVNNVPIMTFFAVKEHFMKGCERDTDGKTVRFAATMKSDVEASKEDFVIEAKRLNQLSGKSKNIVRVNEVFEENHTAYYVMQFLDGGELSNVIEKNGPLSEAQALNMIMPIATAVDIIHREHLLHLDIKPDNIVLMTSPVDGTQYPVLIDFGIAKHFSSSGKPTSAHSAKGASDGYAPMEQYANIDSFAPEMDVYALGASLYYFLTGKTPKKAFDITEEDVEKGLPNNISKKTRKAIIGAMQPFRQNRTKSVKDFIEMLEESYTLTPGTVIKSPKFKYRIIGVAGETPYYIIYNALPAQLNENKDDDNAKSSSTRMLNSPSSRKNSQRKGTGENKNQNFRIYEMFVRNQFKRNEDGTVVGKSHEADEEFDKVLKNEVPKNTMDKVENGMPLAEEFKANGTRYLALVGPKKSSNILDVFSSISSTSGSLRKSQAGKSTKLIWYIAGGLVATALIAWIIMGAIGGNDDGNNPKQLPTETVQEPAKLNESNDDKQTEQQENKQENKDNDAKQTNTQPAQQPEVPVEPEIVKPELPKNASDDAKQKEEEAAKKKAREAEAKRQAEQAAAKKKAADEAAAAAARKKAADDAAAAAARKKAADDAAVAAAKKKAADDAAAAAAAAKKKADDEAAAKKKAEYQVNSTVIDLYWNIGEYVSKKAVSDGWGKSTVKALSDYILSKEPGIRGYSSQNIWRMKQFYETYREDEFVSALLTQISWTNHLMIMSKAKSREERDFYVALAAKERYSLRELERQLDSAYYERYMPSAGNILSVSFAALSCFIIIKINIAVFFVIIVYFRFYIQLF